MRYSQIRWMDISNGEGIGMSLFVQGCHFHCKNCFNKETWDFNEGKLWKKEIEDKFLELINRPYIKRISILGGEPLANENVFDVLCLVKRIKNKYPDKKIWLYTGYRWEEIFFTYGVYLKENCEGIYRRETIKQCDYLIDGRYEDSLKDMNLKFRGSSNQRIINVQESFICESLGLGLCIEIIK